MPVLFRTTTRISHSKSLVVFGEREEAEPFVYQRNNAKYDCAPAHAYKNHAKVEKNLAALEEYSNRSPLNRMEMKGSEIGVITASIAYQYAKDVFPEDTSFLKLGLTAGDYTVAMHQALKRKDRAGFLKVRQEMRQWLQKTMFDSPFAIYPPSLSRQSGLAVR